MTVFNPESEFLRGRYMGKLLTLADIQALAVETPYGGTRELTSESAVLLISAASLLYDYRLWQGASYTLTDDEMDDIAAMVAQAEYDLLEGGESPVSDYVKIAEAVATSDCSDLEIDNFESGTFHTYELLIQGMKSNFATNWIDSVDMVINDDTTVTNYNSFGRWFVGSGRYTFEHIGDHAGYFVPFLAATSQLYGQSVGHCKATFFDPQGDDYKIVDMFGSVIGFVNGKSLTGQMSGMYENSDGVAKIRIAPTLGSLFKVDPASNYYPSELRMTLYGLK